MKRLAMNGMVNLEAAGQPGAYTGTLMNSTEELVARVRHGDEEAFRLIFDRYSRPLISFIYDMVGSRELAEDLTQETFVRAYKSLGGLRDESKLSTWLFGIAKTSRANPYGRASARRGTSTWTTRPRSSSCTTAGAA